MAGKKHKIRIVIGAVILIVLASVVLSPLRMLRGDRLRLPVGPFTPMISLGETHGVIIASDGSLWTWGSDFVGWPVLGLRNVKNQTVLARIGSETNWATVSAASDANLAIKSDGTLWAWGANYQGQLGDSTSKTRQTPVPSAPGHDWKQAAISQAWSIAVKTNGTLWAWGANWYGQLGIGSRSNSIIPVEVGNATNWTKVWAGDLQSVGMQSDGSLWVWGDNPDSPIGINGFLVPKRLSADTNWVDVSFGTYTAFGLKSDGTLWTWGRFARAYAGQPAKNQGSTNNPFSTFFDLQGSTIPLRVGTNADWKAIAESRWWYQILLKKDGTLWALDATEYDHVKPPFAYRPIAFRQINLQKDFVAIAGGNGHGVAPGSRAPIGVALTRDGEVWTWGMVLGESPTLSRKFQIFATNLASHLNIKIHLRDPEPVIREQPWQLRHLESGDSTKR